MPDVAVVPDTQDVIISRFFRQGGSTRWVGTRGDTQVFESTDQHLALHLGCAIAMRHRVRCFLDDGDGLRVLVKRSSLAEPF